MALSEIERDDLVKYRLDRAYETLFGADSKSKLL